MAAKQFTRRRFLETTAAAGTVGAFAPFIRTAHAAGTPTPTSSVLNPDGSGAAIAGSTIVPMSPSGLALYTSGPTDLLVDLVGWFTGASAAVATDGLFVAVTPTRLVDTRSSAPRLWTNGTRELAVDLPGAGAVVTRAGTQRRSRSRLGGSIVIAAICAKGSQK